MAQVRRLFEATGPLATQVDGFRARPQQQAMAELVENTLANYGQLVVEAGTGVGKTFAYLVPALLCGQKVIIATGTRHLQDQLYHRDLPVVRKALSVPLKTSLLKGRANYLCLHRLEMALEQVQAGSALRSLHKIKAWAGLTKTGDIAELSTIPDNSPTWAHVTSTVDNCLGLECPAYSQCSVVKARRAAQEADLVVINHHLFFADLALKEQGFGDLLPSANAFIFDEAHQLPEIASRFFGVNVSRRQLQELARDSIAEQLRDAPDMKALRGLTDALIKSAADLRLVMGEADQRRPWAPLRAKPKVSQALEALKEALEALRDVLEVAGERGKGLKNCSQRATQLQLRLALMDQTDDDAVRWFETSRRGFVLHHTPLEIASLFREQIERYRCAWVFTSATLTVGGRFDHFVQRLGLYEAACKSLDSPYDYRTHALLYLPNRMPDTGSSAHTQAVVNASLRVIAASGGRTFVLFTSHRALREASQLMQGKFDYPLFVQGQAPRRLLLERFREAGNAVLLGTSSFWEGVDVRGSALSCVIIDKLPFASPGDPVIQARLDALRARGGNPFAELQIPQAVIALKQGVGRLIRDEHDTGVLMICDPRLQTRSYGRIFLDSLPEMPKTHDLNVVQTFLGSRR